MTDTRKSGFEIYRGDIVKFLDKYNPGSSYGMLIATDSEFSKFLPYMRYSINGDGLFDPKWVETGKPLMVRSDTIHFMHPTDKTELDSIIIATKRDSLTNSKKKRLEDVTVEMNSKEMEDAYQKFKNKQ
jgi:hypothetical protein